MSLCHSKEKHSHFHAKAEGNQTDHDKHKENQKLINKSFAGAIFRSKNFSIERKFGILAAVDRTTDCPFGVFHARASQ